MVKLIKTMFFIHIYQLLPSKVRFERSALETKVFIAQGRWLPNETFGRQNTVSECIHNKLVIRTFLSKDLIAR